MPVTGGRLRWGSSPLTRGKPRYVCGTCRSAGLIPAHAGKTPSKPRAISQPGAHPRSRGENVDDKAVYANDRGSSPLTRGKQGYPHTPSTLKGLIPAHAGKTSALVSVDIGVGAHPRSRGENFSAPASAVLIAGSSPLMRGKPKRRPRKTGRFGLIPAHAGKTKALEVSLRRCGAHPRSRGENRVACVCPITEQGSSPLTRGKHLVPCDKDVSVGLIPAHAGKTQVDNTQTR